MKKERKLGSYLPSEELGELTGYHLSLNLELLRGCQFSCKGCHVDIYGAEVLNETYLDNLETWVSSMTNDGGYIPTICFLGPTDFLVADNTIGVLTNPKVVKIINRFGRLGLQSTLLNLDRLAIVGDVLRQYYSDLEVEINILMEPEHIETSKYLETVKGNRDKVYNYLDWKKRIKSFCIMNVYEYEKVKKAHISEVLVDYTELHSRIKDLFDSTIDFNFSMSRKTSLKENEMREAISRITNMFDESISDENNQFIRFSFGKLTDCLVERHYNFFNGRLYTSPLVYDRIVAFIKRLEIPLENYTYKETEAFEDALILDQYNSLSEKSDCGDCKYLASCIDRGVLTIMNEYNINDCIIARDALNTING